MKKLYLLLLVVFINTAAYAQDFTWVKGSSINSDPSVYGTMGVPAPANTPGGRHGCAKWVDLNGNLWLFGGEGPYHDWWNDLWKYNVSTNEWTWVRGANTPSSVAVFGTKGISAPGNEPGAREFANCWTDASGNFWMFGGDGFAATVTSTGQQRLGDLWKYNPTTNEWTFMNGFTTVSQNGVYGTMGTVAATNVPGCRFGSCTWADNNGNLWMFGGHGYAATGADAYLNDLWKYNIATNQWTWMGGTNTFNQNAIYGTLGVPATTNMPGAKYFSVGWADATNNLFLFGGTGFNGPISNSLGRQNELWKYDPAANTWAWINGSQNIGTSSVYGTQNVSSPSNVIGGREGSAGWKDLSGNFWVFGGDGVANSSVTGSLNDLFKYDPITNEWTWMKGATITDQHGTYGTLGVSVPANVPGGREFSTYWATPTKLWLFGGLGFDISSVNISERLGDLWSFRIPCNPDSITVATSKTLCSGSSTTLTAVNGGSTTAWYNSPVSTTSISGGTTLSIASLTTAGTPTVYSYYAEANSCTMTPRASVTITVNPLPTLIAVAYQTLVCQHYQNTLTVSGANTYTWNTTPPTLSNSLFLTLSVMKTYTYIVTGEDLNNCTSTATVTFVVTECGGISEISNTDTDFSFYPNPNAGEFKIKTKDNFTQVKLNIFNELGQKVFNQMLYSDQPVIKTGLTKGLYYYTITLDNNKYVNGKLIIE